MSRVDGDKRDQESSDSPLTVLVPICGNRDAYASGQNYVQTLLDEIQRDDRGIHWLIGLEQDRIAKAKQAQSTAHVSWLPFPKWSGSSLGRLLFEQLRLPAIIRAARPDVVYFSANFMPVWSRVPSVLSIRSLLHYHFPEEISKLRRIGRRILTRMAVRKATHIVCPSESLAEEIHQILGVPSERITAVLHGTNPVFLDDPQNDRVLDRFALRDRGYFLYPASLWEYKNHRTLIRAVTELSKRGEEIVLVLAGWGHAVRGSHVESLRREAEAVKAPSEIIFAGGISLRDLNALYTNAIALVFPSTCESFGNPIVEAMARNCPIVSSNCHALPEVVAGGGILLAPYEIDAWVEEMSKLASQSDYRRVWAEKSASRKNRYRAERAIDELVSVIRRTRRTGFG